MRWPTLLCAAAFASPILAAAQCPEREYRDVRHEDDFSYLRDPACRDRPLDGLKFIALGDGGTASLSFGGETRQRYERFPRQRFEAEPEDRGGHYGARYMLSASWQLADRWRLFAQVRHAEEQFRSSPSPETADGGPDLHEAFFELPVATQATLRLGRQEIVLPSETPYGRLSSARDSDNLRRSFDGVRVVQPGAGSPRWTAFAAREVEIDRDGFDQSAGGAYYWGIRGGSAERASRPGLDGYYYGLREIQVDGDSETPNLRHTVGGRVHAGIDSKQRSHVDIEAALQVGRQGREDVLAGFAVVDAEYGRSKQGFGVIGRLGWYSGDIDPADGRVSTFDPIYSQGTYLNDAELVTGSNIVAMRAGITWRHAPGLSLRLSYDSYHRATRADAVYDSEGVVRDGTAARARHIGGYASAVADWEVRPGIEVLLSVGRFYPGRFLRETVAAAAADFIRFDTTAKF